MTSNPFGGAPNFCPKSLSLRWHLQKKKKKGHHLFRCTFSITIGLNMPPDVCPNKCWPFFFFFLWRCYCSDKFFGQDVRTLTQIARKIKSCPKFLQPGGAGAPPDPPLRTPMYVACNIFMPHLKFYLPLKGHSLTKKTLVWFILFPVFIQNMHTIDK